MIRSLTRLVETLVSSLRGLVGFLEGVHTADCQDGRFTFLHSF
jgi:hypothetical protein